MRRRWQSWSESDKIAAQVVALAVLAFLYFAWPTPYVSGSRVLPQNQNDFTLPASATYRVQVNRFSGTVWADTVEGWRRFESMPLPQSQLAFEKDAGDWYDPEARAR